HAAVAGDGLGREPQGPDLHVRVPRGLLAVRRIDRLWQHVRLHGARPYLADDIHQGIAGDAPAELRPRPAGQPVLLHGPRPGGGVAPEAPPRWWRRWRWRWRWPPPPRRWRRRPRAWRRRRAVERGCPVPATAMR